MPRHIVALLATALVAACASSHVIVGTVRPPISPDQVKIYLSPPKAYEQVAIIDSTSRNSFSFGDQAKMNKAIERLKKEAASLGANGILLQGTSTQPSGSVSAGAGNASASGHSVVGLGFGISGDTTMKAANGLAIYVTQE